MVEFIEVYEDISSKLPVYNEDLREALLKDVKFVYLFILFNLFLFCGLFCIRYSTTFIRF
jgi:hypothetical protein